MKNSSLVGYSCAKENNLPTTKLRVLNIEELSAVNGGISFGSLVSSMVIGAFTGALRGISAGPAGMVAGAIFGAGMGAAGQAIADAAEIHDRERSKK